VNLGGPESQGLGIPYSDDINLAGFKSVGIWSYGKHAALYAHSRPAADMK